MRTWLAILTLAGFLPQQFACCVADCGTCVDSGQPAVMGDHHPGGDHCHSVCLAGRDNLKLVHSHAPMPSGQSPDPTHDSDHHLCVSTHVFFVGRATEDPTVASSSLSAWLCSEISDDSSWNSLQGLHVHLPYRWEPAPDTPQRRRARLSVCIV